MSSITASQKPVFALSTTTIAPLLGRPSLGFSKNPEATFTAIWSSPRTQALLMSMSPWCSATSMCMTGGISTLPSDSHVNASSIALRHSASNPTQARSSDSVNMSTGIRFSPLGGAREAHSGPSLFEPGSVIVSSPAVSLSRKTLIHNGLNYRGKVTHRWRTDTPLPECADMMN